MKKITNRAVSVLLIAALIIGGMVVYVLRYVDEGRDWALYFARANSGSTGVMTDVLPPVPEPLLAADWRYSSLVRNSVSSPSVSTLK